MAPKRAREGMIRIVCADDGTTVYLAADEADDTYFAPLTWSAEGGTVSANIPSSAVLCAVLFIRHGITPKPKDLTGAIGIVDAAYYLGVEGLADCTLRWIAKKLADPHCAAPIPTLLGVLFTATQHGALPGVDGASCMAARTLGRRMDTMTAADLAALHSADPRDITVLFEHACFCPASPAVALAALFAWAAQEHSGPSGPSRRDEHLTTLAEPWIDRAKSVPSVLAALLLRPAVSRNARLVHCIGTALVSASLKGPNGPFLSHGKWCVAFAPDGSVSAARMAEGVDSDADFANAALSLPRGVDWMQHATLQEPRLVALVSGRRVVVADLANPTPPMVYCIRSGSYTMCPPLPRHTTDYAIAVCRDAIYVIGGNDPHSPTDDIWRIRTPDASGPRESWSNIGTLDAPRAGASATLIYPNGRPTIAVFGGAARPGNALELVGAGGATQTLSVPTSADIDRKFHSAAAVTGADGEYTIIVVGGRSWHAEPRAEVPHAISLSPASGRHTFEPLIAYAGPRSVVVATGAHTVHVMGAPLPARGAESAGPLYNACAYNIETGLSKRGSCPAFTSGSAAVCFAAPGPLENS